MESFLSINHAHFGVDEGFFTPQKEPRPIHRHHSSLIYNSRKTRATETFVGGALTPMGAMVF